MMKIRLSKKNIPFLILIFFGIVVFSMGLLNHYLFRTVAHDYGNYNFAFWDYSHFRISPLTSFRGNFLQDHFSFTLMYFIPVFWLLNWITHTYTLIIIQQSFVLIAAWYSYKLVRLKSDNLWLGAGVIFYYFILLGRYTAFSADVNLAIISACFIPIFIYYFKTKKYILSLIILILSLFSRENIPIWFIFIFVVLLIDHRKEKKAVLISITGIIVSVVYFILLFKVFIPSIETPGISYQLFNYAALGKTPGDAILFILNHPVESVKLFFVNHLNNPAFDGIKAEFYWVYLISGGFILLLRPKYIIWFIPIVAQKVLNDLPSRWGIVSYYSIEVVTLLPLSVFLTLASIRSKVLQNSLVIIICIATIATTIYKMDKQNLKVPSKMNASKVKIYDKAFYKTPFDVKKVNQLLKQIPPEAKVSASNILLPHLAQRQHIYFFPNVNDADYIIFSVFDNNYLFNNNHDENIRNMYFSDPNWKIIAKEFPVFLLKHGNSAITSEISNSLWNHSDTLSCDYERFDTDDQHQLLSKIEIKETKKFLTSEKSRSEINSIKLTPENKYSTRIKVKNVKPEDHVQIDVWCLCKEEKDGHVVGDYGKDFHFHTSESDSIDSAGWAKYSLSFWIPKKHDPSDCSIFFFNSGTEPAYFDDLQIIVRSNLSINQ